MIICLDPGHSGPFEPGACCPTTGLQEAAVVLAIALSAREYLTNAGHEVVMTRAASIQTDDLDFRCQLANTAGANLYVSIHANGSARPEAHGTETYCFESSDQGRLLARHIQQHLVQSLNTWDRGVKTAGFYVLKHTAMPAALAEIAFISNESDRAVALSTASARQAAGYALAAGILNYIADVCQTNLEL